jgi:ABC-type branched-subunit amino acid transport system ATPase component
MPYTELTPEQLVEKQISSTFDSVNLINELKLLETLTEEEEDRLNRNQEHLLIMLRREDFKLTLSSEQLTSIEDASSISSN